MAGPQSALSSVSCPCGHPGPPTFLEWTSSVAHVDYYRCDECGHVWTVAKNAPDGQMRDVTERRVTARQP